MKSMIVASLLVLLGCCALVLADGNPLSQIVQNKSNGVQSACAPDIKKLCAGTPAAQVLSCLKSQTPSNLTSQCAKQVGSVPSAPAAPKMPSFGH